MSGKEDPTLAARKLVDKLFELYSTPDRQAFVVPRKGGRPLMLTAGGSGAALGVLQLAAQNAPGGRIPRSALIDTLQLLYDIAPNIAPSAELHLRAARPEADRILLDLGEPGTTRHVEVTGDGWRVRSKRRPEVHFRLSRASRPLPVPESGNGHSALRTLLGWRKRDPRWLICRGWLAAALFPDIARPLLFPDGRSGSGKTSRGLTLVSVLDPRDELGGSLGKDERDQLVAAASRYLAAWDNVSSVSHETSNFICRLVTGGSDERRALYTDEDAHVRAIRRTGVITGLSRPLLEPDAVERIIPLHCDAIPAADRTSEERLKTAFERAHPAILGAVLDDVATILRRLPEVQAMKRDRPRMAGFSDLLYALDPAIDRAYQAATADMVREIAEGDPFVQAVVSWLRAAETAGRMPLTMAPADALTALRASIPASTRHETWLPRTPAGLAQVLTKNAGPLAACGFSVTRRIRRGQKLDRYDAIEGSTS